MKRATLTIASKEYEKQYQVQLESLKQFLPEFDHKRVYPEEFKSNYTNPLQHICSIRPKAVLKLFELGYDEVLFLGADVVFYSEPHELQYDPYLNAIVTPHILDPLPNDGKFPSNEGIAKFGHINSDLVLWKNHPQVINFLEWQAKIMETKCIQTNDIFLDQTWLNFLPFFVDDVGVLRDPAYNVAYWNYKQREGIKPVCFQFSGFDPNNPEQISVHQNRYKAEGEFLKFLQDYARRIK